MKEDNSTRDKRIIELHEEGKNNEEIARALDRENVSAIKRSRINKIRRSKY